MIYILGEQYDEGIERLVFADFGHHDDGAVNAFLGALGDHWEQLGWLNSYDGELDVEPWTVVPSLDRFVYMRQETVVDMSPAGVRSGFAVSRSWVPKVHMFDEIDPRMLVELREVFAVDQWSNKDQLDVFRKAVARRVQGARLRSTV